MCHNQFFEIRPASVHFIAHFDSNHDHFNRLIIITIMSKNDKFMFYCVILKSQLVSDLNRELPAFTVSLTGFVNLLDLLL